MTPRFLGLALLIAAGAACADEDADALALADTTPVPAVPPREARLFGELALGQAQARANGSVDGNQRLSLDFKWGAGFAPGWRAHVSNRLDVRWRDRFGASDTVHSLREAFVSWQPAQDRVFDAGRINARYGVATGYNPTDYFRGGAIRSLVSVDPASLKQNRLGSVMLRAQRVWDGGSLSGTVSPKLADARSDAPFSADWGATNNAHRALLVLSQRLADGIDPQWLLLAEQGKSPQFGFNLAALLGDATVVHAEWSGGRSRSQLSEAVTGVDDSAFRSRLVTGFTFTTAGRLSLIAELHYDGVALEPARWDRLLAGSPPDWVRYRRYVQDRQELPLKRGAFLYATWQDAFTTGLDVNAMLRLNPDDNSRMMWLEARYRLDRAELALQVLANSGRPGSEYGTAPARRGVQAVLRYFL